MKRIGVVMHGSRADAVTVGRALAGRLAGRGIEVQAQPADAVRLERADVVASETFPEGCDLVLVLGGDGTLLRAAGLAFAAGVPLLGVNLGRLGFLAELERGDAESELLRIVDEGFEVEERSVLRASVHDEGSVTEMLAVNEIMIGKVEIGRAVKLAVEIGGEPFVTWAADGVIVATPTGSTAYSFSAGGPIVSPRLDLMVVTPVAPHGVFNRSVVVPPDEEVVVRVVPEPDAASLSADGGPPVPLSSGAVVHVRAGGRIKLAKVDPAPFWRLVREKLELPPGR